MGRDLKSKVSLALYALGMILAFVNPWLGCALYVVVSAVWFLPDRRIERTLTR